MGTDPDDGPALGFFVVGGLSLIGAAYLAISPAAALVALSVIAFFLSWGATMDEEEVAT